MHYEHLVDWMVQLKNQAFPFTEAIICVVNLLMLQLRICFVANVAFTCFFVANVVITRFQGQNFTQNFWQKFSEIRRILAENLRKILAVGASAHNPISLAPLKKRLFKMGPRHCSLLDHKILCVLWLFQTGKLNCLNNMFLSQKCIIQAIESASFR